jgi:hypothetical protein
LIKYIFVGLAATVPSLWIEEYTFTNPIWWTVMLILLLGNFNGYMEGIKKNKEKEKQDEE